jgi:glucose-6-phosphate 1-dehydrogenase
LTARIEAVAPAIPAVTSHPAPPCAIVIFGATGDLTHRKLVPALFSLWQGGALQGPFAIVGIGRRDQTADAFRTDLGAAVREFGRRKPADDAEWTRFASMIEYVEGDFHDAEFHARLAKRLDELDAARSLAGNRLYYLATAADEFGAILHRLKTAGLIRDPRDPSFTRVIVEKPFGSDLESARVLNDVVANVLDESQTFRIDHYLGKETVQNILVFRFANSIFEPMWNRKYVDHVQITAAETVGVGTRGAFYEKTGVLRDIVQNHLLEVLSLVAMEPPTTSSADDIRGEKLKVIHALREPWKDTIDRDFVLGQYRGYRAEPNVAPQSLTPTFAALRVFVDNWRWQGVPFYLRAGKQMAKRVTEVSLFMQDIPLSLFGRPNVCENLEPNVLTLRIQPDEGIELSFASKIPGHDLAVGSVKMDMRYVDAFGGEPPEAYERLLLDAMRGDATLFSRRDAVEASWGWITPVLRHFDEQPPRDFPDYEPGSWGPPEAEQLLQRDRRAWRSL